MLRCPDDQMCAAAAHADIDQLHKVYLTPASKRKGKGGRQPATDPRLDPSVDPKKARRILANRLSAARSKLKQRSQVDVGPLKCWKGWSDTGYRLAPGHVGQSCMC